MLDKGVTPLTGMSHDTSQGGYKLVLVPLDYIRTHSPAGTRLGEYVTVAQDVMYEAVGDVGPDRQLRMTRELYEQIEIVEPRAPVTGL